MMGTLALAAVTAELPPVALLVLGGGATLAVGKYYYDKINLLLEHNDSYSEHTKGARNSTKGKHESGQARKSTDRGGEKADGNRRYPNKKPSAWKGPWPPKQ